jgi:hypothetical protein
VRDATDAQAHSVVNQRLKITVARDLHTSGESTSPITALHSQVTVDDRSTCAH